MKKDVSASYSDLKSMQNIRYVILCVSYVNVNVFIYVCVFTPKSCNKECALQIAKNDIMCASAPHANSGW